MTLLACGAPRAAVADVVISVNKSKQTMSVLIDGRERYNWTVSTGVGGGPHDGTYRPDRMERHWASRKYGMAPMPYSIFFDGNYAIHGTTKVGQLGRRASKGCVRLHPRDAAVLFALVQKERASTSIVVSASSHVTAGVTRAVPAMRTSKSGAPRKAARPKREAAIAAPATADVTGTVMQAAPPAAGSIE